MQELLEQLKIKADVMSVESNGSMSKYYLQMRPGGRVSRIERCAEEIALGLKSYSIPIIRLIPEQGLVAVELLTSPPKDVRFSSMQDDLKCEEKILPIILGKTHDGNNLIFDLANAPHLLIAGTTGSGKSVMLHSIICSLMSKNNVRLALVDPKNVEFTNYSNIRQLMYPVINYANDAYELLSDLVDEMDQRFKIMSSASVNDISSYNEKRTKKSLPYIVLIIDEFADLMQISKKEFQTKLSRLAQKSRACGIHIVIATQRPSADIITGVIKANFPARISCKVTSAINSRVVLEEKGAEKLLGRGDAMISANNYNLVRFQGAFLEQEEIDNLCKNNKISKVSGLINYFRSLV